MASLTPISELLCNQCAWMMIAAEDPTTVSDGAGTIQFIDVATGTPYPLQPELIGEPVADLRAEWRRKDSTPVTFSALLAHHRRLAADPRADRAWHAEAVECLEKAQRQIKYLGDAVDRHSGCGDPDDDQQ